MTMLERWRRIGVVAAGLFGIAVVARLISRFFADDNPGRQDVIAWTAYGAIALTLAVMAFLWGRRWAMVPVVLDLAGAALVGCLVTVFIGPFISGSNPFATGAGNFFGSIWLYAGVSIVGGALGLLAVTAAGKDYRSQALKRFTESERSRPHRPVRR